MMIEIVATVFGAMGGIELVKWLHTRKSNSRIVAAQAENAEFQVLQDTMIFLQGQLKDKELRFAEQTALLRKTQEELFTETNRRHQIELELAIKRCNVRNCPTREPQTGY